MLEKDFELESVNLKNTNLVIKDIINNIQKDIKNDEVKFDEFQKYLAENQNLDKYEILNIEMQQNLIQNSTNEKCTELNKFERIKNNPYFAKLIINDDNEKIYIGIKNIEKNGEIFAIDWRVPICSLFYDSELGETSYNSPQGEIKVNLKLKRQFKIENGTLKYFYDTEAQINDDILLESLSNNSSNHMKNIVSTIQNEQNIIIRENPNVSIVVNGIAGSGKTSVGMHRIAYLLYLDKENLTNKNILIISPNKLFTEYISNVLPELGEENVETNSFVQIFNNIISNIGFSYEKNFAVEDVLNGNISRFEEMKMKYSYKYFLNLKNYLKDINSLDRIDKDFTTDTIKISKENIKKLYYKPNQENIYESISVTIERLIDKYFYMLTKSKQEKFAQKLFKYFKEDIFELSTIKIYTNFLISQGLTTKFLNKKIINYEDLSNLVYIKLKTEKINKNFIVKQIFVDEMQDYDATTIMLINELYPNANVTMVGDYNQNLLFETNNNEAISEAFSSSKFYDLKTNYRSTANISNYACKILNKKYDGKLIRTGNEPILIKNKDFKENIDSINTKIEEYKKLGMKKIAIICKTEEELKEYAKFLKNCFVLSNEEETIVTDMPILTTIFFAKGLEFDAVIVPNVSKVNYSSIVDRRILYVICTRALHDLTLFYYDDLTDFLLKE